VCKTNSRPCRSCTYVQELITSCQLCAGCILRRRFLLLHIFLVNIFLQPIRLVDYKSLKKSICRARFFSSRLLKQFMDWASTSSCDRLFHLLITLWVKKYKRVSQRLCFFTNFQACPLVEVSSAFLKNSDPGKPHSAYVLWQQWMCDKLTHNNLSILQYLVR